MRITVKGKSMQNALANVKKIIGSENATLYLEDGNIWIVASANQKTIKLLVEGVIESKSKKHNDFGFSIFTLMKLIGSRQEITLETGEGKVEISYKGKGSKVSGNFATGQSDITAIDLEKNAQELKLDPIILANMHKISGNIGISDQFGSELDICVFANKDGLRMCMYDNYHMAYYHDPSLVQEQQIQFSFNISVYRQIASLASGGTYTLHLGSAYITAKSESFEVSLPIMQAEQAQSVIVARQVVDSLGDLSSANSFTIDKSELLESLETVNAISSSTSPIILKSKKAGSIELSVTNQFGSISDKRKVKGGDWGKLSVQINPVMYYDILGAYAGSTVTHYIKDSKVLMVCDEGSARYTYMMALNQG